MRARRSVFISAVLATMLSLASVAVALAGDGPVPGLR